LGARHIVCSLCWSYGAMAVLASEGPLSMLGDRLCDALLALQFSDVAWPEPRALHGISLPFFSTEGRRVIQMARWATAEHIEGHRRKNRMTKVKL
jgi:hypothetical protein